MQVATTLKITVKQINDTRQKESNELVGSQPTARTRKPRINETTMKDRMGKVKKRINQDLQPPAGLQRPAEFYHDDEKKKPPPGSTLIK